MSNEPTAKRPQLYNTTVALWDDTDDTLVNATWTAGSGSLNCEGAKEVVVDIDYTHDTNNTSVKFIWDSVDDLDDGLSVIEREMSASLDGRIIIPVKGKVLTCKGYSDGGPGGSTALDVNAFAVFPPQY